PQRLEDVGAAATARCRPVAVLGDGLPASGHGDGRGGRDVPARDPTPAGAASVDDVRVPRLDDHSRLAHRGRRALDLGHSLAFEREPRQEATDLNRIAATRHNLAKDLRRELDLEVTTLDQLEERTPDGDGPDLAHGWLAPHAKKFCKSR